jgi:hypothetical protein
MGNFVIESGRTFDASLGVLPVPSHLDPFQQLNHGEPQPSFDIASAAV